MDNNNSSDKQSATTSTNLSPELISEFESAYRKE